MFRTILGGSSVDVDGLVDLNIVLVSGLVEYGWEVNIVLSRVWIVWYIYRFVFFGWS